MIGMLNLASSNFKKPFTIYTNASGDEIGAILVVIPIGTWTLLVILAMKLRKEAKTLAS